MLRGKKIAVFIDVDNALLDYTTYNNVMQQIRDMGEIVCATVYGASERKHKKVIDDAKNNGYTIQLPMRNRRRVKKVFDSRIYVDVATLVSQNNSVDAVAVISAPDDMVYLFSYLRRLGLSVIAGDRLDEQSASLVAETVDLGKLETIKLPKKTAPKKSTPKPVQKAEPKEEPKVEPVVEEPKAEPLHEQPKNEPAEEDETDKLMAEIRRLREEREAAAVQKAEPKEEPKAEPVVEEPVVEEPAHEEPAAAEEDSMEDLLAQINALKEQHEKEDAEKAAKAEEAAHEEPAHEEPVFEEPVKAEPKVEPAAKAPVSEEPAEEVAEGPRATYVSQNDGDLMRKIEELRKSDNSDEEILEQIKKLLDGLD